MTRYASGTEVSPGRSREEIERILTRYGADSFGYISNKANIQIMFRITNRLYLMTINLPEQAQFNTTETGRARKESAAFEEWEKEVRRMWRVLSLGIKAKLEMIASGVSTVEQEFLAYTILPNGRTVNDFMDPQIEHAYKTGDMPAQIEFKG